MRRSDLPTGLRAENVTRRRTWPGEKIENLGRKIAGSQVSRAFERCHRHDGEDDDGDAAKPGGKFRMPEGVDRTHPGLHVFTY